jgi:hypothetical protein
MYKNATKCNETIGKWCKNKHGASKIIDTFETYQWFKAHDEWMKITYGDAKVDEHLMLIHAQWQAMVTREKSDGASCSS